MIPALKKVASPVEIEWRLVAYINFEIQYRKGLFLLKENK